MAPPTRRSAAAVYWTNPAGKACALTPMSGGQGLLEIEIQDDLVNVHSRNCLLIVDDDASELAEYEFTLSLQRCQLHWSILERTEETEIERSKYYSQ